MSRDKNKKTFKQTNKIKLVLFKIKTKKKIYNNQKYIKN